MEKQEKEKKENTLVNFPFVLVRKMIYLHDTNYVKLYRRYSGVLNIYGRKISILIKKLKIYNGWSRLKSKNHNLAEFHKTYQTIVF